jgi:steroid delta-isomerase-like uncharacterized protein
VDENTQTTLALIYEVIDAMNRGDKQRFMATGTPRAVHKDLTLHQVFLNHERITEWAWIWREAFPDLHFNISHAFATSNRGVAEGVWVGTHLGDVALPLVTLRATGKEVRVPAVMTFTTRDAKIVTSTHYFDLTSLLAQIGRIQIDRLWKRVRRLSEPV